MCHDSNLKWRDRTGVLVLLLLFAPQIATSQGRLYWTEPDNLTIMSSNFDGSTQRTEGQGQALDKVTDVDIDQETGWLYWTKYYFYSGAAIARSSPDGRDGGIITRDVAEPNGIAVDGVNGYIYWTEDSRVRRSNLDGTARVDLVSGIEWTVALEISTGDQLMFWTGPAGTYRSTLDGAEVREISNSGGDNLGVDPIQKNLYLAFGKAILRMDFDGIAVDTVVNAEFEIHALAVEPQAERLCWVEVGPAQYPEPVGPQQLMCSSTDGSNLAKIVDNPGVITGLAINRRSRMIYMIDQGAKLLRCKHDGTGLEDLTRPVFFPLDVAVDPFARKIYSVDGGIFPGGPLTAIDFGGAAYKEIEITGRWGLPSPGDLTTVAVDPEAKSLYVGTTGSCSETYGTIITGPTDGPLDNDIGAASCVPVRDIELDLTDRKLYYTQDARVWRRDLDGSDQVQLLSSVGSGIALSRHHLYWLDVPTHSILRGNLDGTDPISLLSGVGSIGDLAVDTFDRYLFWSTPGEHTIKRLEIGQSTVHEIVTADVEIGGLYVVSAPSNVTQIAPLTGSTDLPTTVSLMWSRPPDAQRYDVQVASGANINDIVFAENTPHNQATFVAPVAESNYYWRVRSSGAGGYSPFTGYAKFTVGASGPLAATLAEPVEGETGVAIEPTFRWTKASEAVYHQLQVADNSSFTNPILDVDSLSDDYLVGAMLSHETTYYWRVAGIAADGKYTFTAPEPFTTIVAVPEAITLLSPDASEEGIPAYANFSWQAASSADSYRFELASDSLFAQILIDIETAAAEYALETPLAYNTRYFWRVCGGNDGGEGPWSEQRSFRTVIGTGVTDDGLPSVFALGQNFPNPFGLATQIRYDVPRPEHVSIVVFDALGRQVERLVDVQEPVGSHVVTFDAAGHPTGLYFYRMRTGSFERVRTMVVTR